MKIECGREGILCVRQDREKLFGILDDCSNTSKTVRNSSLGIPPFAWDIFPFPVAMDAVVPC